MIRVRISSNWVVPKTAGRAFAAGFGLGEIQEKPGDLHHAVVFIQDHHAAGAHDGADPLQGVIIDGQVQKLGGNASAGRTAHLHGLEFPSLGNAAADIKDHVLDGRADGHFHQAGVVDLSGQRKIFWSPCFFPCPPARTSPRRF